MKIEQINFYAYSLPLKTPLKMMGTIQNNRSGYIIEIIDTDGSHGLGDAAPFPGLHKESLKNILEYFKGFYPSILQATYPKYKSWLKYFETDFKKLPSLNFALQTALINLFASKAGLTPAQYVNAGSAGIIHLNALITATDDIEIKAEKIRQKGYQFVKIKVGINTVKDEIVLINTLNDIWQGQIKLRLDANRKWSIDQAIQIAESIDKNCIDYVEEPLENPEACNDFYNKTGIPYAFDESLSDGHYQQSGNYEGLKAFILKPSVLGSFYKITEWLAIAKMNNYPVIFSSAFESGIGLNAIANLAAAFAAEFHHGLDTFRWLSADTIVPAFNTEGPVYKLPVPGDLKLNTDFLTAVSL